MKQLSHTSELIARLKASFGEGVDVSKLAVFEAIAVNTLPLRKSGGLYKGAVFSTSAMTDMAAFLETESVPLQLQHDTGALPSGRVFAGRVQDDQLFVQFALNRDTQAPFIADIDAGMIDQVSVGALPKKLMCSECNFDYLGDSASFENLWTLTCDQGHTIGENGVHARLIGCAAWFEMSLVGQGAVRENRIIAPSESAFASGNAHRLAASAAARDALILQASPTIPAPKKDDLAMDKDALAQLLAATEAKTKAESALEPLKLQVTTLTEANTALNARVTELQGKIDGAPKKDDFDAAIAALQSMASKVMVACGDKDPKPPATVAELTALIEDKTAKLTALIPATPRSEDTSTRVEATSDNRGGGRGFRVS